MQEEPPGGGRQGREQGRGGVARRRQRLRRRSEAVPWINMPPTVGQGRGARRADCGLSAEDARIGIMDRGTSTRRNREAWCLTEAEAVRKFASWTPRWQMARVSDTDCHGGEHLGTVASPDRCNAHSPGARSRAG